MKPEHKLFVCQCCLGKQIVEMSDGRGWWCPYCRDWNGFVLMPYVPDKLMEDVING